MYFWRHLRCRMIEPRFISFIKLESCSDVFEVSLRRDALSIFPTDIGTPGNTEQPSCFCLSPFLALSHPQGLEYILKSIFFEHHCPLKRCTSFRRSCTRSVLC